MAVVLFALSASAAPLSRIYGPDHDKDYFDDLSQRLP